MSRYNTANKRTEDVNLNVNWEKPLQLKLDVVFHVKTDQAVTAILTIGGRIMPGQITVDTTNEVAKVLFVDDKGDTDAAAPEGAVVTYTSDNTVVATIDPQSGQITPVAEGTANIGATIADANGNQVLEPDGVTPFSVPATPVTVSAGQAQSAELTLSV